MNNRKAGFPGHDSMRDNAERMLGKQLKHDTPPENMPPRCYKAGGHVKNQGKKMPHKNTGGLLSNMGPTGGGWVNGMSPGPASQLPTSDSPSPFKKGGKVQRKHKAEGGMLTAVKPFETSAAPTNAMKRGGHAHKKHADSDCRKHMAMGGVGKIRHQEANKQGSPIGKKSKPVKVTP